MSYNKKLIIQEGNIMSGLSVTRLTRLKQELVDDPVIFFQEHSKGVKLKTRDGHGVTLKGIRVPGKESYAASGMRFGVATEEEDLTFTSPFNAVAYVKLLDRQNKAAQDLELDNAISKMFEIN